MTQESATPEAPAAGAPQDRSLRTVLTSLEIDGRLLGMVAALLVIWVAFNFMSGGLFLSPRNLWNLSVQSAAVAIMTCGMVLIIVSRNIDLSIGSILAFTALIMGLLQTEWLPITFGLGVEQPFTRVILLAIGIALCAPAGCLHGYPLPLIVIPAFIVTLGGLLVWRGAAFALVGGR